MMQFIKVVFQNIIEREDFYNSCSTLFPRDLKSLKLLRTHFPMRGECDFYSQ